MAEKKNVVKPIAFANENGIVPQQVYAWMRSGDLVSHTCECGGKYLIRSEADAFLADRAAKKAAKSDAKSA